MTIDFDKAYKTYKPKLTVMLSKRVKDKSVVEDLVQETFLRVHRYSSYYNADHALSTWLYTISFNVLKNYYKSLKGVITYRNEVYDNEYTVSLDGPEDILIAKEVEETFNRSLNKLGKIYLDAYTLREVDNLTYKDIATQLDITEGCVKSRIKRARDFISAELK